MENTYIPVTDQECTNEYIEGFCECCDHFEQCLQAWRGDEE